MDRNLKQTISDANDTQKHDRQAHRMKNRHTNKQKELQADRNRSEIHKDKQDIQKQTDRAN